MFGLLACHLAALPVFGGPAPEGPPPAPPAVEANDDCAGATILEFLQGGAIDGDLSGYVNDYDPADPGPSCTGHPAAGHDLVLAVEVPCAGSFWVEYTPQGYDGSLYVVTDCSDIAGTCILASDHDGIGVAESVYLDVVLSNTFYIIVDAREAGEGGPFHLTYDFGLWDIPPGACCYPDGHCEFIHPDLCHEAGGEPHVCVPCTPDPCAPTPAERTSWGQIKHQLR